MDPSAYFYRQCLISADPDESVTAQMVQHLGADYFIWASDYPHIDASFGVVRELKDRLAPLPEAKPEEAGVSSQRLERLTQTMQRLVDNGELDLELSGTTDVAVISLGGIVASTSVKCAGNALDHAVADYIKKTYNLGIGDKMAEEVKIQVGSAVPLDEELTMT